MIYFVFLCGMLVYFGVTVVVFKNEFFDAIRFHGFTFSSSLYVEVIPVFVYFPLILYVFALLINFYFIFELI